MLLVAPGLLRHGTARLCRTRPSAVVSATSRTRQFSVSRRTSAHASQTNAHTKLAAPPFRILMCGTDSFSCTALRALAQFRDLWDVLHIVTIPDARVGRKGKQLAVAPLKLLAQDLDLPVTTVPLEGLTNWDPPPPFQTLSSTNLLITASFGHLIPTRILDLFPPLQSLNLHPSLLPRYRGAAPIQWTLLDGVRETGVSVQELSRGKFDQGRVLAQERVIVPSDSTYGNLESYLANTGSQLLVKVLRDLSTYQVSAKQQDSTKATRAPKISRQTSTIDWTSWDAARCERTDRAIGHQFPLTTAIFNKSVMFLSVSTPSAASSPPSATLLEHLRAAPPGTAGYEKASARLFVRTISPPPSQCGSERWKDELLVVERLQMERGKEVAAKDWWNGYKDRADEKGLVRFGVGGGNG